MDKTGKAVKLHNKRSNIAVNGFLLTAKTVKGTLLITLLTWVENHSGNEKERQMLQTDPFIVAAGLM